MHSTCKQPCYVAGTMQTQREETARTPTDTGNIDDMYQFQNNNPIQESKNKMQFEFKWNKRKAVHVNPSKYGYAQTANSMLKTINFNLQDIKDWSISDSGASSHFLLTDVSATGILAATNPNTAIYQIV